jgi:nuclear receptor coactivator 4
MVTETKHLSLTGIYSNRNLANQVSVCLERPGSLALKPKDLTILIFKADIIVLLQAITFESLKITLIPKHLIAPASLSKISP